MSACANTDGCQGNHSGLSDSHQVAIDQYWSDVLLQSFTITHMHQYWSDILRSVILVLTASLSVQTHSVAEVVMPLYSVACRP